MKAVWRAAVAVRPALMGGKGSESDMFRFFGWWGRGRWRRAENGRAAAAGRVGGRGVRGHSGRF